MHDTPTTLAGRLVSLRTRANMSARQLSLAAGLAANTIAKLELDPERDASGHTIAAVCDVLGCSADWLLRGVGSGAVRGRPSRSRRAVTRTAAPMSAREDR